jgi:hypothetical protein
MNTRRPHRVLRLFSSLVVAASLAAPVASAADRDSDPTLRNDVAHHGPQSASKRPDLNVLNDIAHDNVARARIAGAPDHDRAAIVVQVDGGFDWISAGVGAAGGFGLLLVLGTATATLRRRRRDAPATA